MHSILEQRPGPAFVVAVLALLAALMGTAAAGSATTSGAINKKKVKKIATKQINKLAPGLSVANATHAESADRATNADSATNAGDANTVGGKSAAQLESHAFNDPGSTAFLPAGAGTTTANTLDLPAGSYLILGRGEIENNGDASNSEVHCSLSAGAASARLSIGPALGAQATAGERTVGSAQLAHTFGSPGQAKIECSTVAGWGSGDIFDPTISAISVQP